jgi:hypothetical protein
MFETCECGSATIVVCEDKNLGEAGPVTVHCYECGVETYIPAETTARTRIAALREIVSKHTAKRVDGFLVDATTAALLVKVYEALSPKSREKFGAPSLDRLVELAWKCAR